MSRQLLVEVECKTSIFNEPEKSSSVPSLGKLMNSNDWRNENFSNCNFLRLHGTGSWSTQSRTDQFSIGSNHSSFPNQLIFLERQKQASVEIVIQIMIYFPGGTDTRIEGGENKFCISILIAYEVYVVSCQTIKEVVHFSSLH